MANIAKQSIAARAPALFGSILILYKFSIMKPLGTMIIKFISKIVKLMCTGAEKMLRKTYLRTTKAGQSSRVKEDHEGTSPNHVQAIFSASVYPENKLID